MPALQMYYPHRDPFSHSAPSGSPLIRPLSAFPSLLLTQPNTADSYSKPLKKN